MNGNKIKPKGIGKLLTPNPSWRETAERVRREILRNVDEPSLQVSLYQDMEEHFNLIGKGLMKGYLCLADLAERHISMEKMMEMEGELRREGLSILLALYLSEKVKGKDKIAHWFHTIEGEAIREKVARGVLLIGKRKVGAIYTDAHHLNPFHYDNAVSMGAGVGAFVGAAAGIAIFEVLGVPATNNPLPLAAISGVMLGGILGHMAGGRLKLYLLGSDEEYATHTVVKEAIEMEEIGRKVFNPQS